MDIGTATALNLYNFQTTAKTSGQPAALLQALTQVYNSAMSSAGSDPMNNLLISANMAPVADALGSLATAGAAGPGNIPTDALQAFVPYGGVNLASASALFSTKSSSSTVSSGFEMALTASSALALAAYQAHSNYPTAANAPPTPASALTNILNLLG
jgi:hypothetical protein